jgi:serine/threonine protein kinase
MPPAPESAIRRLKKAISNDFINYVGGQDSISSLSLCVNDSAGDTTFDQTYEMNDILGEGGFAIVYRCRHYANQNDYAVKEILHSSYEEHGEVNVKDEIAALKRLRDGPYIVRLLDVFQERDKTFMVMEELKGGDLLDRITAQGSFVEKEARRMSRTLLEAIAYCHRKGIAHRDIKPENILLVDPVENTKIKLADFGCAQKITGHKCFRTLCGTPRYAAPEIMLSLDGYDERCDLWSAGVVIYALLVGYAPFDGEEDDIPDIVCDGDFEFHEETWSHISEPPKELICSLLELDVEQRATVAEALDSKWLCRVTSNKKHLRKRTTTTTATSSSNYSFSKLNNSDGSFASFGSATTLESASGGDFDGSCASLNMDDL